MSVLAERTCPWPGGRAAARAVLLSVLPSVLVSTGACSGSLPGSLESLAHIGRAALPVGPEKEHEIGFGIAATLAGRYDLVTDEGVTRYVNLVGQTVATQSTRREEIVFRFGVLDADDVNAFAAPGGYVFVTRGALERMISEAELAGVLAHEVAHVDEEHVLDQIRRSSVAAEVQDESQLSGEILDRLSAAGSSLLFTGLGREDELEADSIGVLYAAASGYRPDGLVRFLERLGPEADAGGALRDWTATHPPERERTAALRRQMAAAHLDPGTGRDLPDRFRLNTGGPDPGPQSR